METKMKHTKLHRLVALLGIGLMIVAALPLPISAQVPLPTNVEAVAGVLSADDADTALLIKYVGPTTGTTTTQNSGTVEVSVTTSDFTFLSGAQGSEAADTSLECPVSGALGGIIDVSNAACNTAGEICDIINAPTSNFRCVILDALRSDSLEARLVTMAATRATNAAGVSIKWDTSTAFDATQALTPWRLASDYIPSGVANARRVVPNKYDDSRTVLVAANATSTYGSGTSTFTLYSVDVNPLSPTTGAGSETVTTLYSWAGGATTANQVFSIPDIGIYGKRGQKLVARLDNSAAMSAVAFRAFGFMQRFAQ